MNIYGNNFLISIAYKSASPTQAANLTRMMGYSRQQVRDVRNAAALLRDEGEDKFNEQFMPYTLVDIKAPQCQSMKLKLDIDKTYEKRPLNPVEYNEVAAFITAELSKFGIKVQVDLKPTTPYIKSTLKLS